MPESEAVLWATAAIAVLASIGMLHACAMFMKNQQDVTKLQRRVKQLKADYARRSKEREENGEDLLMDVEVLPSKRAA